MWNYRDFLDTLEGKRRVVSLFEPFVPRGIATKRNETLFTVAIAIVVTLAMSWVGLMVINSLLVLPAAASRNLARNLRQYHLLSVLSALLCGLLGLCAAYWLGCSAGATIALLLAVYFAVSFALRNRAA